MYGPIVHDSDLTRPGDLKLLGSSARSDGDYSVSKALNELPIDADLKIISGWH